MADTCEALATTTLGSATSAISFSSISASYEHLLIVGNLKSTQGTDGSCEILVTLNSDTGSNYETQGMVVTVSGGLWNTTTAVNAVTLTSSVGNLKTNSTLTLLGLRSS